MSLGELLADQGDPAEGQATFFALVNAGTTALLDIAVWTDGPGAAHVTLAIDDDGQPGAWADPGRSIAYTDTLRPGQHHGFWARALFAPEDVEDVYDFELQVTATSVKAA